MDDSSKSVHYEDHSALLSQFHTEILLFTTSTCPVCERVRVLFKQKNIRYTELVVDQNIEHDQLYQQLNSQGGVPLMLLTDRQIEGFNEELYLKQIQSVTNKT